MIIQLAQTYTSDSSSSVSTGAAVGILVVWVVIALAVALIQVIGMWKAFDKAGQKGWMAIVPILNIYVLIKIAGKEAWWLILFLIPCVSIVASIIVYIEFAKRFGKSGAYGIGLAFLGIIFWPMLGFGDAQYQGDRTPIL